MRVISEYILLCTDLTHLLSMCRFKLNETGHYNELLPAVHRRPDAVTLLLTLARAAVKIP